MDQWIWIDALKTYIWAGDGAPTSPKPSSPPATTTAKANDYIGGGYSVSPDGRVFYGGQEVDPAQLADYERRVASTPRPPSVSYNTSQSFEDPHALELQAEELRLKQQQILAQQAQDNVLQQFARDKFAYEQQQGNRTAALQAQQLQEQIAARQQGTALTLAQLKYQSGVTQAQLDFQAAQANASAQLEAQRLNQQAREANLQDVAQNARDLASYAKDPSSAAANAAYLLARNGSPNGPTAVSGFLAGTGDARDLLPGAELLRVQDELAKGPTVYTPPTVSAPRVPAPDFSGLDFLNAPRPAQPAAGGGAPAPNYAAQYGAGAWNPSNANTGYTGSVDSSGNLVATPTIAAANGFDGIVTQPTTFLAGEAGQPERVTVTPQTPALDTGTGATSSATQADGTPSNTADTPLDALERARQFLNRAGGAALARSPWTTVPTPVGVSAPGTNEYIQRYASALAAALRGTSPDLFVQEARAAAPVGLSGAPVRRSR